MRRHRKVLVPSAFAVLLEVAKDQEKKSPELAAKQRRLLEIVRRRKLAGNQASASRSGGCFE